jgi:uncharacterized membrane protein
MALDLTRRRNVALAIVLIIYIVVFLVFSLGRYALYNAEGWDLGIFSQLTWNAAHGRPMQNTVAEENNMLAVHAPYITILLAPLMWLWPDPRSLLIAQTFILALGALPVARLASRYFKEWWVPPFLAALWCLYPALEFVNRWDFHEIAPVITFFAFAFEAADRRAWRQFDFWLVLSILCKEEIGLNVAFFGLYALWRFKRNWKPCLFWFVIGIAWFVIHAFVIFPTLRHADNGLPIHAVRYEWLLKGNLQSIWAYITGPDTALKGLFLVKLFAPVAFVAFLAPVALIPALPTFGLSFLSSFGPQFDIYMHYTSPIIPAVFVATVYGLPRLRCWLDARQNRWLTGRGLRLAATAMLAGTLLIWFTYNPFWLKPTFFTSYGWEPGAHLEALYEVEKIIPPDACVVAKNNVQAHYSVRPESYVLGARGDMDGCTYMIADLGDPRHDDFRSAEAAVCSQFWANKRAPIYYKDTVVVLQQMPAQADLAAVQGLRDYCNGYVARQSK